MEQDHRGGSDETVPAEREPVFYLEQVDAGGSSLGEVGQDEYGVNWGRLFQSLWRRKWLILAVALAGIAGGVFLLQQSQPVYQTRATIWLGPADQQSGPIRPAEIFEGQGWADLLSSQAVLEPVVEQTRLFVRPVEGADTLDLSGLEVTERLQAGEYRLTRLSGRRFELARVSGGGTFGLGGLFGLTSSRDSVVQRGGLGETPVGQPVGFRWSPPVSSLDPGTDYLFRVTRPADAVQRIRDNLMVSYSAEAGNLINTEFTWTSSNGAAELHNALLGSFLEVAQRLKSQKQKEVVNILERQTDYAAARLDSAELALRNFRVEAITLPGEPATTAVPSSGGQGTASGSVQDPVFGAFFEQRLTRDQLRSQVEDLRGVLDRLQSTGELDVLALRMNSAVEGSPQLQQALTELTEMRSERRTMLNQYTEDYPPIQELTSRIRTQEEDIIPGLVRDLIEQLRRRMSQLDQQIADRASELREIPKRSIQEERLRREVEMAEQLHGNLLTRLKEAELSARTSLPDIQVVDRATSPGGPSHDPGPRLFMIASMAGIGIGIGGSLLLDRFDRKVRYPDQVTDEIGIRVLGVVPRISSGGRKAGDEREQEAIEAFRGIRGQLSRIQGTRTSVSLITSPAPREGKTLITANLGLSYARMGARTLVVDCDTRRGNLHELFGRSASPGVADYLRGEARLDEVAVATESPGLFLVPRGNIRGFNAELLDSSSMDRFLGEVRERYDVVLLDASPLHAGPDSLFLGERTDQVVVVLRTGQTDRDEARSRLASIGSFDLPVVGAVMNDVREAGEYYQYYYYSYGRDQIEGQVLTG